MSAAEGKIELRARFDLAGQGHVFRFSDEHKLSTEQEEQLFQQLSKIDLDHVARCYESAMKEAEQVSSVDSLEPPEPECSQNIANTTFEDVVAWEHLGIEAVGRGEVAACVLAGGQGTRLGYDGPKGCYDIGLPSGKSFFQIYSERIRHLVSRAEGLSGQKARMPFLVMTSPLNHAVTQAFFADHDYFGLPVDDVWFFSQGTLPCLTREGKIIMESGSVVAEAPDGNGGIYPSLVKSGLLDKLDAQGVKSLHLFGVDNILACPADPRFVGFCLSRSADCGNKCVWKSSPDEKVGVMAKRSGKLCVVEYSELDDHRKGQRDDAERLVYGAGNICNHFFSVDFLQNKVRANMSSMFHLAHKKIPFAGEDGNTIRPDDNNGIKLEAFVFDVFTMSSQMAILECRREEDFSPVKNPPGSSSDSPDTARSMITVLARKRVLAAGGKVEGDGTAALEISPLLAEESLAAKVNGQTIVLPAHID